MTMRLFDFAVVSSWDERLRSLASLAEPERWDNIRLKNDRTLPILQSYIKHTFSRAYEQGRIVIGTTSACFNTGLLSRDMQEIYALFNQRSEFNSRLGESSENKRWYLHSWCLSGDRRMEVIDEIPKMCDYWTEASQIVFDPRLEVQPQVDHILRDNIERFPQELGGSVDSQGFPLRGPASTDDEDEMPISAPSEQIPQIARNVLDGAIRHSVSLARRSYRVAVPQFYRGRIQLLLPLYLRSNNSPDLALTLDKQGGWYRAATVLYMDWAYSHARLLARPNSEWLGGFLESSEA